MDKTPYMDPRVAQINSALQIIRQTDEAVRDYMDGWLSEEAYGAAMALRDACRADVARLCAEIEGEGGTPPVAPPEQAGSPVPERVGTNEDAIVELADLSAGNEVSIEELTQGVLELAEMIGGDQA
jgi:hypothetical protein